MADATSEDVLNAQLQIAAEECSSNYNAAVQTANTAAQAARAVASTNADAQTTSATTQANAQTTVATTQANAEIQVAQIRATADEAVANTQAGAAESVATTQAGAAELVATTSATAQKAVAETEAGWRESVAEIDANAQTAVANINLSAAVQAATIDASWHANVATIEANAQVQAATLAANAQTTSATTNANASITVANINQAGENNRLATSLAFATDKFNDVLPIITSLASSFESGGSGGGGIGFGAYAPDVRPPMGFGAVMASASNQKINLSFGNQKAFYTDYSSPYGDSEAGYYHRTVLREGQGSPIRMTGGGDVPTGGIGFASGPSVADAVAATVLPPIFTVGVLTPSQIQAQVNAATARADSKANSTYRQLVGDLTGRGFSAASPILGALQVGIAGQTLQTQLATETQIRLDSAKLNSDQILNSQKAASDQYIQQENVLVEVSKNQTTLTVGVVQAVFGMIGNAL
jgi:hypothetical protein